MTEWDLPLDDSDTAKGAFVTFCACALVFLISKPLDLYARLSNRNSAGGDSSDHGAEEGGRVFHDGLNITGAQRDHG